MSMHPTLDTGASRLVVVADDYGLCKSVNGGIIEAYAHGIVTEVSLMLGSPGTDHALQLVSDHSVVNLGIHMLLKNWRDTGALVRRSDYIKLFEELNEAEVGRLVEVELEEFERLVGHRPTHITSQFGIIAHEKAMKAAISYAKRYNIPMRQPVMTLYSDEIMQNKISLALMRQAGVQTTDEVFAHIMGDDYEWLVNQYKRDLEGLTGHRTAEIILHPGYVDNELRAMTSLADERARDLKLATDVAFKGWVKSRGIEIVAYKEIK